MLKFYRTVALTTLGLLLASLLGGYLALERTFLHAELLPSHEADYQWQPVADADEDWRAGGSSIKVNDSHHSLDFEFTVRDQVQHPYANVALDFTGAGSGQKFVDLSEYTHLVFSVRCTPENILFASVLTVDEQITRPSDTQTYRGPITYFSCTDSWQTVRLDLTRLEVPDWWFEKYDMALSERGYQLNKVASMMFGMSAQSPKHVPSQVKIDELVLEGRNWTYLYIWAGLLVAVWSGFLVWLFRQHGKALVEDVKEKIQRDRPLVAYQQLTLQAQRDTEKQKVLQYLATEYANPDLNLDYVAKHLGVSRNKISKILKDELGYTFVAYLNKLRLTEAARLLAENENANVSEIAFMVGYGNVSYFIKLFREEYGCTPNAFRKMHS